MIQVKFDPNSLEGDEKNWWSDWLTKADLAREAVVKAFANKDKPSSKINKSSSKKGKYSSKKEKLPFDNKIWTELKEKLLKKIFHEKCAYCESKFSHVYVGDVDHFRPKGRVTVKAGNNHTKIKIGAEDHPGYYWLAYDYRNLLPSCKLCNSSGGKLNQFPVDGKHVLSPKDGPDPDKLDLLEKPLLVNPYKDEPGKYLVFGVGGVISAVNDNPHGRASIEVYNLMRGDLVAERWRIQQMALLTFKDAIPNGKAAMNEAIKHYRDGSAPYSRAVLDYIKLKQDEIMEVLQGL